MPNGCADADADAVAVASILHTKYFASQQKHFCTLLPTYLPIGQRRR